MSFSLNIIVDIDFSACVYVYFIFLYFIRQLDVFIFSKCCNRRAQTNDMTDYVQLPNSTFAHDQMHLAPPNGLQGGAYFSMLYYKDAPLYIQTPACTSRQGVVSGKRPYIDLMFSNHDVPFLEWLEAMEAAAVRLIYEKRNVWISSDIERADIEAGFTSPVRPYKGGKHYLIRAHIQPAKHLASPACSVFDENERPVPLEYIKPEQRMYAVLEFQGIKFTARSFQLEVSLKQVLIVPNVPMFQSCVIRKPSHGSRPHEAEPNEEPNVATNASTNALTNEEPNVATNEKSNVATNEESNEEPNEESNEEPNEESNVATNEESNASINASINEEPNASINASINEEPNVANELQEVNMDEVEELEHMHMKLKKPTEVYYNMYRIAKQKARELKKNAIAAYLEAKQIKSAHMLEDSSDESDEEEYE
jgi:hypothetical protein